MVFYCGFGSNKKDATVNRDIMINLLYSFYKEQLWLQVITSSVLLIGICTAPVPLIDFTLQCDASESGLGYALLQQSQPVAFGAHGMTETKRKYEQIKKEMCVCMWLQTHCRE